MELCNFESVSASIMLINRMGNGIPFFPYGNSSIYFFDGTIEMKTALTPLGSKLSDLMNNREL